MCAIHDIPPGTHPTQMCNDDVMVLWGEMIRNRRPEHVLALLHGTVSPDGADEEHLKSLGSEMARRDLFASMCLV